MQRTAAPTRPCHERRRGRPTAGSERNLRRNRRNQDPRWSSQHGSKNNPLLTERPRSRMCRRGQQLVARVVDQPSALVATDPPGDLQRATGIDARDLASAQPYQRDGTRSVAEFNLERGMTPTWTDRHRGHLPRQLNLLPILTGANRYGTRLSHVLLELFGLQFGVRRCQAAQCPLQHVLLRHLTPLLRLQAFHR